MKNKNFYLIINVILFILVLMLCKPTTTEKIEIVTHESNKSMETLIFSDDFHRADSQGIGNGWIEQETNPDEAYIKNNAAVFNSVFSYKSIYALNPNIYMLLNETITDGKIRWSQKMWPSGATGEGPHISSICIGNKEEHIKGLSASDKCGKGYRIETRYGGVDGLKVYGDNKIIYEAPILGIANNPKSFEFSWDEEKGLAEIWAWDGADFGEYTFGPGVALIHKMMDTNTRSEGNLLSYGVTTISKIFVYNKPYRTDDIHYLYDISVYKNWTTTEQTQEEVKVQITETPWFCKWLLVLLGVSFAVILFSKED